MTEIMLATCFSHRFVKKWIKRTETKELASSNQPPYVKFWGGIGYFGKSDLVVCDKPFNSSEYIRVLKKGLRGADSQYDGTWELRQDGDPVHTSSAKTLRWMARRTPPVSVLKGRPSGLPDASVIENAWSVPKDNITARAPRSKKELIRVAQEEWRKKLDLDFCRDLIDSMPRRLLLILRAKGGPIKYWLPWSCTFTMLKCLRIAGEYAVKKY
jgi:hypothetical protein